MLTRFIKFILFASVLSLNFNDHKVYAQNSCTTPSGNTGVCISPLECKTITQLLRTSPRPLPPSVTDLIRKSYCGTFDQVHFVCCDSSMIENGPATTTTQRTRLRQITTEPKESSTAVIRPSPELSSRQIRSGMSILDGLITECGKSDAKRISNGEDVSLSEYPWMALLVYSDGVRRTLDCGGSLITDRYVLTAAHCIPIGLKARKLKSVRLGEHDTSEPIDCVRRGSKRVCAPPIQEIDVEEAIYHNGFRRDGFVNDIALVRLVSPASFRSNVKPICLPITKQSKEAALDRLIISGWGLKEDKTVATILQKAIVPLRENNYCDKVLKLRLNENHLCAGGGNARIDTCVGDSGGPIFYAVRFRRAIRYVQYGVVSGGSKVCGLEFPSIFARVQNYLDWIAGNLSF